MKTKFFFLLAALLLSVCAFAQSGNGTLKGDVNNDGTVDVADINAIIEIMKNGGGTGEETKCYFSIGTEAVTADNYTTANNATTIIPTTMEYSATVRNYHYILIPSTKTMTITDKASGGSVNITEQTSAGINGHKLYKTNGALSVGGTVVITLSDGTGEETKYYWYVGTTKPTSLSQASTVTSYPAEQTYTNNSGAKSHIFVLTNSNKNVTFIEPNFNSPIDQNEIDTTTISGYKIFETAVGTANTGSIIIRIS